MNIKTVIKLKTAIYLILCLHLEISRVWANPIPYDPMMAMTQMSFQAPMLQAPMMMGPQFDPYGSMLHAPSQYMFAPPLMPISQFDSHRRSLPGIYRDGHKSKQPKEMSDEQKALGDLPVSFLDPDPPSTITERISDSFSALGEGVKNHFRSMSENFSDTLDDIKDAWKISDNKRG